MIPEIRKKFNSKYSDTVYKNYVNEINSILEYPADFRISETPVFLTEDLTIKIIEACNEISAQLLTHEYKEYSKHAIPEGWNVPGETEHPEFLQIDFGITKDYNGLQLVRRPRLPASRTDCVRQPVADPPYPDVKDVPLEHGSFAHEWCLPRSAARRR